MSLTDHTPDGLQDWTELWPEGTWGHPVSSVVTTFEGGGEWDVTSTRDDGTSVESYYSNGLLACVEEYGGGVHHPRLSSVNYDYDVFNRLTRTEVFGTGNSQTTYVSNTCDAVASVTDPGGHTTSYSYDHRGRRTTVDAPDTTDAGNQQLDNVTVSHYYPDGSLKEVTGGQTHDIGYTYDYAGRKKSTTTTGSAGNVTTAWNYDPANGWLLGKRYNSNPAGTTGSGPDYEYTAGGRLLHRWWVRNAPGQTFRVRTEYGRDNGGRLTSVTYNDGTPSASFQHDTLGRITYAHDSTGGGIDWTYDDQAHFVDTQSQTVMADLGGNSLEGFTKVVDWKRNPAVPHQLVIDEIGDSGNQNQIRSFCNWSWSESTGRLSAIQASGGWNPGPLPNNWFAYGFLNMRPDLVESVTGPLPKVTNLYEPARDVLKSKSNDDLAATPATLSKTEYGVPWSQNGNAEAVNGIGQREKATYTGSAYGINSRLGSNDYGYNGSGELVNGLRKDAAGDPVTAEHFEYAFDGIGNRNTASVDGQVVHSYGPNELNQYIRIDSQSANRAYDLDGNLADDGNLKYEWDAENRLIAVRLHNDDTLVARYAYDPLGRRVRKTTTSAAPQGATQRLCFYDGWNLLAEYRVTGASVSQLRCYNWGPDVSGTLQGAGGVGGLLAIGDYSGENPVTYYPLYDGNGNVTQLITDDGSGGVKLVAHYEYDPFGNLTRNIDADSSGFNNGNPFRFSTKYFDQETQLYYYGYRYYDPLTGRWPSRDPIEEDAGSNLYEVVGNDLVGMWDKLGLMTTYGWGPRSITEGRPEPTSEPGIAEHLFGVPVGDQTTWFNSRFPHLIEAARGQAVAELKLRLRQAVCNSKKTELDLDGWVFLGVWARNWAAPWTWSSLDSSRGILVWDNAFGDPPQSMYSAGFKLGKFAFRVAPQKVVPSRGDSYCHSVRKKCCTGYCFKAKLEIRDNIGPSWAETRVTRAYYEVAGCFSCREKLSCIPAPQDHLRTILYE